MRFLAALLLLTPAPQDKDAEALYKAMKEKIQTAKSLRFEYVVTLGQTGQVEGTFKASVKAKGKDRWTMEFVFREGTGRRGLTSRAGSFQCDGRKILSRGGEEYPFGGMKPEEVAGEIRHGLVTCLVPQVCYMLTLSTERHEPELSAMKSGGKDKVGERDTQILEYALKYAGGPLENAEVPVKLWVDAWEKRPLKRELTYQGRLWTEAVTTFAIDEEIPDSEFSFQSKKRLAQALAGQVADSVRHFGQFSGRPPKTLNDLVKRPTFLEPEVFWPEGGFVLGGVVPRDPWGRPFELRAEADGLRVVSLGADGKAGGKGDDEDVVAPVAPATRRAVGAPTERLKKYYAARVHLHLLASTVRAFRATYCELPKKKEALWEKPEGAEVWPEGGWIPGGKVPTDPWGDAYRIVTQPRFIRVQVNDPKARTIGARGLTADERSALEAVAQPRLTEAEKKEIAKLLDDLGDDDLETREKAMVSLKGWGLAALPLLEARAKVEKDSEARGRLQAARREMPSPPPAYLSELAALAITVGDLQAAVSGLPAANERNAWASLKTLATAEADFRANDRDNNKVNDFWVGDVAGLYTIDGGSGMIKLIEVSIALADGAPLEKGAAGGKIPALTDVGQPGPKAGYYFRVMTHDTSNGKSELYAQDTDAKMGKVHNTSSFGFCAYPAEYGVTGTRTFIINEGNVLFSKDTAGEPVHEWPSNDELKSEWQKMD